MRTCLCCTNTYARMYAPTGSRLGCGQYSVYILAHYLCIHQLHPIGYVVSITRAAVNSHSILYHIIRLGAHWSKINLKKIHRHERKWNPWLPLSLIHVLSNVSLFGFSFSTPVISRFFNLWWYFSICCSRLDSMLLFSSVHKLLNSDLSHHFSTIVGRDRFKHISSLLIISLVVLRVSSPHDSAALALEWNILTWVLDLISLVSKVM